MAVRRLCSVFGCVPIDQIAITGGILIDQLRRSQRVAVAVIGNVAVSWNVFSFQDAASPERDVRITEVLPCKRERKLRIAPDRRAIRIARAALCTDQIGVLFFKPSAAQVVGFAILKLKRNGCSAVGCRAAVTIHCRRTHDRFGAQLPHVADLTLAYGVLRCFPAGSAVIVSSIRIDIELFFPAQTGDRLAVCTSGQRHVRDAFKGQFVRQDCGLVRLFCRNRQAGMLPPCATLIEIEFPHTAKCSVNPVLTAYYAYIRRTRERNVAARIAVQFHFKPAGFNMEVCRPSIKLERSVSSLKRIIYTIDSQLSVWQPEGNRIDFLHILRNG